ncbi:MAG: DUF4912 domain-containing protein, partial [Thermoguttaceae bacterium]
MISATELKTRTVKDLAAMARKKKVLGWHAMRKDELVQALIKYARLAQRRGSVASRLAKSTIRAHSAHNGKAAHNGKSGHNGKNGHNGQCRQKARHQQNGHNGTASHAATAQKKRPPRLQKRLQQIKAKLAQAKDLTFRSVQQDNGQARDRLVVMVRDPYWLHAYWELNRRSIERARAAMGQHWHNAHPILRLHEVSRNGTTST